MAKTKRAAADDKLDNDLTCVLCRMDEKGETLAEAIEAVTGQGDSPYTRKLTRMLQGASR